MRDILLVVDDVSINRILLKKILSDTYDVAEASDGVEAVEFMKNAETQPSAILLDIIMPNMDGHGVIRWMKSNPVTQNIPVLFITMEGGDENETIALHEGAIDYIRRPFNASTIRARVDNHVQLNKYRNNLEEMVEEKTEEINRMHTKMLDTFATIIEYRSLESGLHIQRTMELTKILVSALLGKPKYRDLLAALKYESIIKAVPMHDIGKVGIPDNILLKPGKLTPEEFEVIKSHTLIGRDIIDRVAKDMKDDQMYLLHSRDIALYHHERWDGAGYCSGLKGEDIPLSARIVSVVDVYDALVSKRCYKDKFSYAETIRIINDGKGTQFDPDIVDAFLEVSEEFMRISDELNDDQ